MKKRFKDLSLRIFRSLKKPFIIGNNPWKGAVLSLFLVSTIVFIVGVYNAVSYGSFFDFIKYIISCVLLVFIIGTVVTIISYFLKKIPPIYVGVLIGSLLLLGSPFITVLIFRVICVVLSIAIFTSILGACIYSIKKGSFKNYGITKKVFISMGIVSSLSIGAIGIFWIGSEGSNIEFPKYFSEYKNTSQTTLELLTPGKYGNYKVNRIYYGSGNDLNRKEFGDKVDIKTHTVDGSSFVEGWSKGRTKYLGFDSENMPLNGSVWYPEGEGAFPLVVMVHGNHDMVDYSDGGYDYLGKLLASKGYIFVSVEENFLNLTLGYNDYLGFKGLKEENDARGWILLEHINLWQKWNNSSQSIFYKKVDMNSIAVMGHSRGGEAAAVAAALNKLKYYPDNANVKLDYNFNIRSVVAVAPTDGQYKPCGTATSLTDVNYFVLHGAHDMDVINFDGANQYERVKFTGEKEYFKASLYIYGANHGQFNTSWGRSDISGFASSLNNRKQLMPKESQEKIVEIMVTAFLESTLKDKIEYSQLFRDIRYAKQWLPDTIYINNYEDSNTKLICTFEEDIDVTTGEYENCEIKGENLTVWKEKQPDSKTGKLETKVVYLGWDKEEIDEIPSYTVDIPGEFEVDESSTIVFSAAQDYEKDEEYDKEQLLDFTIKVYDSKNNTAELPLSYFSYLLPKIEGKIGKGSFGDYFPMSQVVLQSFEFKLSDFEKVNKAFNPSKLNKLSFVFNKSEEGEIVIDNLGIRE
ncbi:hypothetical protein SH2C18_31710 [Clostridium sediminicola]|uniref:poly(ethylene terephthalate) hydrolase family protein n=1 Tax=Clostridium sediminicola TaxID=3114879 RepID=UPI0031F27D9D